MADLSTDVQPRMVEGLPHCDEACPNHDGKRCRATGFRPDRFCEPALDGFVADRNLLRNRLPGLTATLDEVFGIVDRVRDWLDRTAGAGVLPEHDYQELASILSDVPDRPSHRVSGDRGPT